MSEMIERVAERIHQGLRLAKLGNDVDWADEFIGTRTVLRITARAVIAAMHEPTLAMADAPYKRIDEIPKTDPPCYPIAYQKMIDAALAD